MMVGRRSWMVLFLALTLALAQAVDSTPQLAAAPLSVPRLPVAASLAPVVDRAAAHGLAAGGYPGVAIVIGRRDSTLLARGYGHGTGPRGAPRWILRAHSTIWLH